MLRNRHPGPSNTDHILFSLNNNNSQENISQPDSAARQAWILVYQTWLSFIFNATSSEAKKVVHIQYLHFRLVWALEPLLKIILEDMWKRERWQNNDYRKTSCKCLSKRQMMNGQTGELKYDSNIKILELLCSTELSAMIEVFQLHCPTQRALSTWNVSSTEERNS